MSVPRPQIIEVPEKIGFGQGFTVPVNVPDDLSAGDVKGKQGRYPFRLTE